jgi:hypothetical protein
VDMLATGRLVTTDTGTLDTGTITQAQLDG